MRAGALQAAALSALCGVAVAGLGGCERRPSPRAAEPSALPACRPGDLARTAAGPTAFADGWVQLKLVPCPGRAAAAPARLEVEGATTALGFQPGRSGAATLGVITALGGGAAGPQGFDLPAPPGSAELVVLAPRGGTAAPRNGAPRIGTVRVVSR